MRIFYECFESPLVSLFFAATLLVAALQILGVFHRVFGSLPFSNHHSQRSPMRTKGLSRSSWPGLSDFWPARLAASLIPKGYPRLCRGASAGAFVARAGRKARRPRRRDGAVLGSDRGVPRHPLAGRLSAFAWANSYSGCLDDVIRPSGALQEVEFTAATG
jgi:hypothetical protein